MALVNGNTSDWFQCSSAKSMKTSAAPHLETRQPNCRAIFNIATALLSLFFLDPFARLFYQPGDAHESTFSPNLQSILGLVEQAHFFTEWCKFL